jgi:2-dehydro-3-deoxyphosphogluconate aldolase/(4S)-4-hydroxy-2-oxoglutarate aldolase
MVDESFWTGQKVIPVVVIKNADNAVSLAQTLVANGVTKIEITMRTPAALDAISRISHQVPGALVGAGTVLSPANADAAIKAGAKFLVSPGSTPKLLSHLIGTGVPFLPGCATVSEALNLIEAGVPVAKFFPAEESGGAPFLKGVSTVLQAIKFCPTGGINKANYLNYLALPNVLCVGGSWIAPGAAIDEGNWAEIAKLASEI